MGLGGHEGECISMYLSNTTSDTFYIRIEPGRTLSALDTNVQDILITREELLTLAPGEGRNLSVFGFCSQASNASPDSAEMFSIGSMADSSIVALAEFLDERDNDFPTDAIQKAVWCMTDDHSIMNIYSDDLASIADLRNFVAELKGINAEAIKVEDVPDDGRMFSAYARTISGEVELLIPTDCIVDIYICDSNGNQVDEFEKHVPYKAGTYRYSFKLTTTNWPPGEYFLTIRGDGKLLFEKSFDIGR